MINTKERKDKEKLLSGLTNLPEEMVRSCWKPSVEGEDGEGSGKTDGLLWHKDLGNHMYGEFSMAVVQANNLLEDRSQLESGSFTSNNDNMGPQGTFIGVYDGHGGHEASQFVTDNLFSNFKSMAFIFIIRDLYVSFFNIFVFSTYIWLF